MKDGTQPSASFTEQSLFCKLTVLLSTGLYPKPEILFCFQNIWTQIYVFKTLKISTVCFNLPAVYVQCWYAWELTIIVGEQKLFTNLFIIVANCSLRCILKNNVICQKFGFSGSSRTVCITTTWRYIQTKEITNVHFALRLSKRLFN